MFTAGMWQLGQCVQGCVKLLISDNCQYCCENVSGFVFHLCYLKGGENKGRPHFFPVTALGYLQPHNFYSIHRMREWKVS